MFFKKPPRIFVQIASYRDPECQWTVKDLFLKADHPERINVGICSQCDPAVDQDCFTEVSPRPKQTKMISVLPQESLGVCWARAKTQTLFDDEDYVLMIDSHMRFIKGWDTAMIDELKRCDSKKPFLSTYPPGYKPPDILEPTPKPVVMRAKPFTDMGDIRFEGESLSKAPEKPLRGAFLAGGFIFAAGKFVREVPYDPYLYFDHEEITLAARAFTHGWDVFSSPKTFVYHYYVVTSEPKKKALHWSDNRDWGKLQISSRARYNYLLAGVEPQNKEALKEIEKYGLGAARSLSDFEAFSGIDFKAKTVSERGRKSGFIEGIEKYRASSPVTRAAASKSGLAPLTPLEKGDFIPPFQMRDDTLAWREVQLFAGKPNIVCILPVPFEAYITEFIALYRERMAKFSEAGVRVLFIAPVTAAEALGLREKYGIPQGIMADEGLALCAAFGALDNITHTPVSFSLDSNQRIGGVWRNRNALNHISDLVREAARLKSEEDRPPMSLPVTNAPVLIVPDVLSADLRSKIIKYWEEGEQYAGTIGVGGQERVSKGKRRTDVDVKGAFLAELDVAMCKRLFPEIRKVFALDVAYRDRYKIGLYSSEDQGFYNLHRDTGVPELAHRRVSVSFVLNDDFEGGWLQMPEYGPHARFRAAAGSAICFPSAVLHGVSPVTAGKRFIMVSFFHGEAEEGWRKFCHETDKNKYGTDEIALRCDSSYSGLVLSHNFYTRSRA